MASIGVFSKGLVLMSLIRNREVAVKVQIFSVTLSNDKSIDLSFSARIGDAFIIIQSGKAHMNFDQSKPSGASATGVYDESILCNQEC